MGLVSYDLSRGDFVYEHFSTGDHCDPCIDPQQTLGVLVWKQELDP